MEKDIVWVFTNKHELTKGQFIDYFERKIFRTIRKFEMLPADRIIKLKKGEGLSAKVLEKVLKTKFEVEVLDKGNFVDDNLSFVAEDAFENFLKGKFVGKKPVDKGKFCRPLYFLSDAEIQKYAELTGVKGKERKKSERVQGLFEKFMRKNPDLEHNIVNALAQL